MSNQAAAEDIILRLSRNTSVAHQFFFPHRHTEETPPWHAQVIKDWHADQRIIVDLMFRGAGKSSIAEEAIVVMACFQRFHNALLIGETEDRARERLAAVKHEFETNEAILELFGDVRGKRWQETSIELANGLALTAIGRGQSLRGVKHLHYRPDIAFCDDLEDEESVLTPVNRLKTRNWFTKTLMPALTPRARIRMAATPLHPEALAMQIAHLPGAAVHKIPIVAIDPETGEERSAWPDRYSIEWIRDRRAQYYQLGDMQTWRQEYLCEAEDPETKLFTADMFKVQPIIRTYQPTYAVYDPARTTKSTSATTGKVVGSWVNNRLILWEGGGYFWKPDEMIEDMFDTDQRYRPIAIGVEEDGLHEFIMQPLRHAQVQRGHPLPIRALKAPKGKVDFIGSLQPFFKAGEVIFAGDHAKFEELEKQLLAFPTGRIDAPNALAYFLKLRPGQPMFENFSNDNIVEGIKPNAVRPVYLVINATNVCVTGVLCQVSDGVLSVFADFAAQGDPGSSLSSIAKEAGIAAKTSFQAVAPKRHFTQWDGIGLRASARSLPLEISPGGDEIQGREQIRQLIERTHRGVPMLRICPEAGWTLRAFTGGYSRDVDKILPTDNVYRTLCEGLESFAGLMAYGVDRDRDDGVRYETDSHGRRFISARR